MPPPKSRRSTISVTNAITSSSTIITPSSQSCSSSIWAGTNSSASSLMLIFAAVPILVATLLATGSSSSRQKPPTQHQEEEAIPPWPCTIPRIPLSALSPQPFRKAYKPFIVVMNEDQGDSSNSTSLPPTYNAAFASQVTLSSLLSDWGHLPAQLHGYQDEEEIAAKKRKAFTLASYLTDKMHAKPWKVGIPFIHTIYLFGKHVGDEWGALFASYVHPPCAFCGKEDGADLKFG